MSYAIYYQATKPFVELIYILWGVEGVKEFEEFCEKFLPSDFHLAVENYRKNKIEPYIEKEEVDA